MLTMIFKKIHFGCAALSALLLLSQAASSFQFPKRPYKPNPKDAAGNWKVGKTQSPLAGRSSSEVSPFCVSFDRTFEVEDGGEFGTFFSTQIIRTLPKGDRVVCTASGVEGGFFFLEMFVADFPYPLPNSKPSSCIVGTDAEEVVECVVGSGEDNTAIVFIDIFYEGTPTTITLACSNEPCNSEPGFCGDGFCDFTFEGDFFDFDFIPPFAEFKESPSPPGGIQVLNNACASDCGSTCGDFFCDAGEPFFEDETNCIRDCFVCPTLPPAPPVLNETLELTPGETEVYAIVLEDGEQAFCIGNLDDPNDFNSYILVAMKFDEPPCPFEETPSSEAPSFTPPACDPFIDNVCSEFGGCFTYISAQGTQVLNINVYSPTGFNGTFVCEIVSFGCDFPPTPAPTPFPTVAPTGSPSASPSSAPTGAPTSSPTEAPTSSPTAAPTTAPPTFFDNVLSIVLFPFFLVGNIVGAIISFIFPV